MAKRGSMIAVITLAILVIALFVFIAIPQIAKVYASGKAALKTASARDIALILDTIYAYPHDIELEYNFDLSDFKVSISNNKVKVYDKSYGSPGSDPTLAQYDFVSVNDAPNFPLDQPKKIIFKKVEGVLAITYIK